MDGIATDKNGEEDERFEEPGQEKYWPDRKKTYFRSQTERNSVFRAAVLHFEKIVFNAAMGK